MGCGSSLNQVNDSYTMTSSSKPLRLEEMFQNSNSIHELNRIYLFGETQTKRKILELTLQQKSQVLTLKKISERYHIPRPKIQRDTIEMMYEEAQQVFPLNMYNSTTLPPFNFMFVTLLSDKVLFLCGGIDFEFWNVCAESFLYKVSSPNEDQKIIKVKLQKPETNILSQKTTNVKENSSRRNFNKFERLAFMNEARYSHMGLSIKHPMTGKNIAYVFGGFGSNKETLKSCEVYSFEKNIWQKLPDMQVPRATGFCFQYLQKIYVFGGFTKDGKRSKKIEVWDLETEKWSVLNIKLHQGIQQGFITSFSPNQIAIIGGNMESGPTNSVIRFNMIEETYKWDSDLIYADSLHKAFNYEKKLYLFGGKKPGFCQIYNPSQKSWSQSKIVTSEDIRAGELTMFSFSNKPLIVDFIPNTNRKRESECTSQDTFVFGTDFYPILYCYKGKDLYVTSNSIPMKLRLRKYMGIARLSNDEYFICGGIDSFETNATKATFNYKSSSKTVEELSKMPTKKYKFGIIKHKNHIYTIGGSVMNQKREEVELKQCCRYNLLTKKWQKLPVLNFCRSECEVIETETGLLVFGGYCDGEWVDRVEYLNTEQQKNFQFVTLLQKLPLIFPMYSRAIQFTKDPPIVKLYILNRNIHLSNFQQITFTLHLHKTLKKEFSLKQFNKNQSKKFDEIDKLQQFDSIDVIITERQKTLEKENESGSYKKKKPIKEENEIASEQEDEKPVDISTGPLVNKSIHRAESKVPQSKKNITKESAEKIFSEEPKIPSLQKIVIKSKIQHEEMGQIKENPAKNEKLQSKKNFDHHFTQNEEKIEEMSLQFQKINLKDSTKQNTDEQKYNSQTMTIQQHLDYENLKSQPMQEYQHSTQQNPNGKTLPVHSSSESQQKFVSFFEPHFIEAENKKVIKGLQSIESINEWIKIKETSNPFGRVIFVRNDELVKCNFVVEKGTEVRICVVKEKYENGQLLFDQKGNGKAPAGKLNTSKLKQIYA